jgi:uncharacterized protein YndB with AHSA1/START domain
MTREIRAGRAIEMALEIAASPEAVWNALTNPAELTRWFPLEAQVTPDVGGRIRWSWGEPIVSEAGIGAWEPGKRLVLIEQVNLGDHATPEEGRKPSGRLMEFTLEGRGGSTTLRLVHSGFGDDADWENELYDGVLRGWTFELRALRHYLEAHPGETRLVSWVRHPFHGSLEETWAALMSPRVCLAAGAIAGLKEGDRYRIAAATGDVFEGAVLVHVPGKQFSATVENTNDGLVRFELEHVGKSREVTVWLSAYGVPEGDVRAFGDRWKALLESVL